MVNEPGRDRFIDMLDPLVTDLGYELVDVEAQLGTKHSVLRVFIDHEKGIGLEDCETVSRQVSALLDVEDPITEDYSLEVSSPGLNRRLVKAEHFERFAGEKVKIRLLRPMGQRRNFRSKLVGFKDQKVLVEEDGVTIEIPFKDIDVARLVPEF